MICKRCGSECSERESGYCLHCQIATDLEATSGKTIEAMGIQEGFPDWQKPKSKPRGPRR